jgi:nitrate/TMAO reductase-like tetraheme cytochrome c subunit
MSKILLLLTLAIPLFATSSYESSLTCKTCHPIIYNEFYDSAHKKSSIYSDPVHKAIWDKHPLKEKKKYTCAKCHTPGDTKLLDKLTLDEPALPQKNTIQTKEAISCVYCHRLSDVEYHSKSNKNIISSKEKTLYSAREEEKNNKNVKYKVQTSFFGLVTYKSGSPFHNIDFTNKNFYDGKMCTGCHSHKQNSHNLDLCNMDISEKSNTKENCISCHMPKVQGSFTTAHDSKTHRYHGFAGSIHKPQMLSKYVKISLEKSSSGFDITIKNEANHQLLLHPLRVGELQVNITRGNQIIKLKPLKFMRLLGKDGKPTMPWIADKVLKDNHIKAKESRKIHFNESLHVGDKVEVMLGHYIVNPKAAKKLGLDEHKNLTKFTLFKKERFTIE